MTSEGRGKNMATNTVCPEIADSPVAAVLQGALARLDTVDHELVLDFSFVDRLDPSALRALEQLASKAHHNSVKLVLRGVKVEVYKVLKLVQMADQFSYLT